MNRYVIYARKSSDREDRQVLSIESQIKELKTLAQRQNLIITSQDVMQEEKSAKAPGRPVFNQMMMEVASGNVQGIICWKLDRLARNPLDGGSIIWSIKEKNLEIITPNESYNQTRENSFMMYVEFGMAQKYIDDLSKNVKRGLKAKAQKGWLPSGAKPGYMNDKFADKGNKTVFKDPIRFPLIRKAWDMMLTGMYTPPQILTTLNNELGYRTPAHRRIGGKPMSRSMIYRVFTDSFYYGEFIYQDELYKGRHEAMITREEFDRVQILLGKRGNPRSKSGKQFYAIGLLKCGECGAAITAEEKHQIICSECRYKFASKKRESCPKCGLTIAEMNNPTRLHYTYYHCTKRKNKNCSQKSVTEDVLDQQVGDYLNSIYMSNRYVDWAIKYLNEVNELEANDRKYVLESLQKTYRDVVRRIDNLTSLKISPQNTDGSILSDEEYKNQKQILLEEKTQLNGQLTQHGDRINLWLEYTEKTFDFAVHASRWFNEGSLETKKYILAGIGSNLILKDKHLRIELAQPFSYITKLNELKLTDKAMFEPIKKTSMSTDKYSSVCQKSEVLPG